MDKKATVNYFIVTVNECQVVNCSFLVESKVRTVLSPVIVSLWTVCQINVGLIKGSSLY